MVGLVGRAVGIPATKLSKIMFFSQYPDQVSVLDGFTNGLRYRLGGSDYSPGLAGLASMEVLHALNGRLVSENVDLYTKIIKQNLNNDAVIGISLHGLVDSIFHSKQVVGSDGVKRLVTFKSPDGHAAHFSEPDYISENQVRFATAAVVDALQIVAGRELSAKQLQGVMSQMNSVVSTARDMTELQGISTIGSSERMELNFRHVAANLLGSMRGLILLQPNDIVSPLTVPLISRQLTIEQTRAFMSTRGEVATWAQAEKVAAEGMDAATVVINDFRALKEGRTTSRIAADVVMDTKTWWVLRFLPARGSSGSDARWGNYGETWSMDAVLPGYKPVVPTFPPGGVWQMFH
jgi:hypothetical protein